MIHEKEVVSHLGNTHDAPSTCHDVFAALWRSICCESSHPKARSHQEKPESVCSACGRLPRIMRVRILLARVRRFCRGPEFKPFAWTVRDDQGRGHLVWSELHMRNMAMVSMRQVVPVVRRVL
jgi:hypothetical protein